MKSLVNIEPDAMLHTSFIKIKNNSGPKTLPCGTPLVTMQGTDAHPFTIAY